MSQASVEERVDFNGYRVAQHADWFEMATILRPGLPRIVDGEVFKEFVDICGVGRITTMHPNYQPILRDVTVWRTRGFPGLFDYENGLRFVSDKHRLSFKFQYGHITDSVDPVASKEGFIEFSQEQKKGLIELLGLNLAKIERTSAPVVTSCAVVGTSKA